MKLKNLTCMAFVLLCLFAVSMARGEGEKYILQNCWEAGSYDLQFNSVITTTKSGDKPIPDQELYRHMLKWDVKADAEKDGTQEFRMKITRLVTRVFINNKTLVQFDSSNDRERGLECLADAFAKIVDVEIVLVVKDGAPAEVRGYSEKMWEEILKDRDAREQGLIGIVQTLLSDDNIKQTYETLSYLDASDEVALGDTWKSDTILELPGVGDKTLEWNCRLDRVLKAAGRVVADVSGTGEIEFDVAEKKLQIVMAANSKYDVAAAFPIEAKSSVTMTLRDKESSDEKSSELITVSQKSNLTIAKH